MRHLFFALLSLSLLTPLSGCGGTSAKSMKQNAIQRSDDDEEDAEAAPAATPPKTDSDEDEDPAAAAPPGGAPGGDSSAASPAAPATTDAEAAAESAPAATVPPTRSRPTTPAEQRQWTIDNLQRIGEALEKYRVAHNTYPPGTIVFATKPRLSWRVGLLPYLGYEELYKKFNLQESWDGPSNKKLLAEIPEVYQSPERFDEKTNYLAVFGANGAFQEGFPRSTADFSDGLQHTAMVVEVDDQLAVPWTAPREYKFSLTNPVAGLGGLREDGFFMIWGGGLVGRIAPGTPPGKVYAMFTIDASERFEAEEIHRDPTAEPADAKKEAEVEKLAQSDTTTGQTESDGSGPDGKSASAAASAAVAAAETRPAVPDEAQQEAARAQLRELFEQRYRAARTNSDRRQLANDMLEYVEKAPDPTLRYVLLDMVTKIAAGAGDIELALKGVERMVSDFAVKELKLRAEAISLTAKGEQADSQRLSDAAKKCAADALAADDYEIAQQMCRLATSHARQENGQLPPELTLLRRAIAEGEEAYAAVARAFRALDQDPNNGEAKDAVGRYYCLHKQDWQRGLPFLAKSNRPEVASVAALDLERPANPELRSEVADGWWKLGDAEKRDRQIRRACHLRATYWYLIVLSQTQTDIHGVKADVRVREAERIYGSEAVEQLRGGYTSVSR